MRPIRLKPDNDALSATATGLLRRQDWDGLVALVRAMPPESAYAALRLLGAAAPLDADLQPLIARGAVWDLTIAGALLQGRAMRFRGLGVAEDVTETQWELYIPTLAHAQELLARANAMSPSLGLTAAWRVTAFIDASEEEKDEAEAALRAAVDIPVSGLSRLLSLRTRKWGGSHEAMWRIVREHARADVPPSMALVAKGHFEQWLWFAGFEEDPALAARARTYFAEEGVRKDLERASAIVLDAAELRDPRALLAADNWFAFAFRNAGLHGQARPHLRRLGRHVDASIWITGGTRRDLNRARLRAWLPPVW